MPLTDLKFKPGINKETTPYSEDNGWVNCDKIRFRFGFPEKLNGWEKNSNNAFLGQCRGLNEWVSNNGTHYLGLGTEVKFYVKEGTAYKDVTPLRQTTSAGDVKFTCTTYNANTPATAFITVTDANHGAVVTDFVTFSGAAQLGSTNITASVLNQEYQITEIVDGNNYKFLPRSLATIQSITVSGGLNETPVRPNGSVSVGGGNSVVGAYQIGTALNNAVFGTGWGAGLWGGTTFGALTTTLNDSGGISDSDTTIILTNATGFVANDFIMIGTELIKIGSVSTNTLSSCVRAQLGTSAAAHADTSTVQLATGNTNTSDDFIGWGDSINSTSQTSTSNLRIWAQDNYGEDLIFNERNGGVFYWDTTNGVNTRAKFLYDSTLALRSPVTGNLLVLTSVPTVALQVLMSDRDRHIIAFGVDGLGANPSATTGDGVLDSLLIRFCSQEDPVDWYPTALNTSGDLRLSSGSTIVQALETRQQILVFTDVSLHSMQYLGTPLTFGLSLISENITIASPKSAVAVGDNVFWMGTAEFYIFSGSVERIPCTVRDFVFDNLNTSQSDKIVAGANVSFAEVWWFYPSANSTENDSYVVYNYMEKLWFTGTLARTAWLDRGVSQYPVATGTDNFLFNQEIGAKDDGSAMTSFVESGDMRMPSGNQFSFISRVIPDVNFRETVETSALSFVMEAKNFPGQVGQTSSTNAVTKTSSNPVDQYTTSYQTRLRGRSFTFKVSSTDENILWRLGVPRIDIRPDGKR